MESALEAFFDEVREPEPNRASDPVRNDNGNEKTLSAIIDIRDMARRYHADVSQSEELIDEVSLMDGTLARDAILSPIARASDARPSLRLYIGLAAVGVLALMIMTSVVTAVLVRNSMTAKLERLDRAVPAMADSILEAPARAVDLPIVVQDPELASEPAVAEPATVEPVAAFAEPAAVEPVAAAVVAEVVAIEPVAEPRKLEPRTAEPRTAEPRTAEPRTALLAMNTSANQSERTAKIADAPAVAEPVAAEPVAAAEPAKQADQACDEVLCLVEGKGCCGGVKAKQESAVAAASAEVDSSLPTSLSRTEIAAALRPLAGRLNSCGVKNGVAGAVTLKLKIDARGGVDGVEVQHSSDELKECLSSVAAQASFAPTQKGTMIRYPVILR